MNRSDYVSALREGAARLAEAADGRLDLPVPGCPDWTVRDLVRHTGEVYLFWRLIASGELAGPDGYEDPAPVGDEQLIPWFGTQCEELAAVLAELDPDEPRWSWSARKDAGFVQRRMAQETAVHCWDAQSAAGLAEPVPRATAVDGVDEFLALFHGEAVPPADFPEGGVHLHATDGEGEWSVRVADGAWTVAREHAKGAVAVRGEASDLLLWLWGRAGDDRLEVFGDASLLEAFLRSFDRD
ncbi:maleylpyruvate isomerase family mycothiol-dependent enzyme [Kitasatospora sp. NPDC051914]|uniref:maleylpyruvate isomerase family mycothiol-dependent enzyme n=1 Tax=Kitasatospora sp. NPDC051914 TaxID=3154945 RepID=UPI003442C96C